MMQNQPQRRERRVVVTGVSAISPIGTTCEEFWEGLVSGRCGAAPIRSFDASEFRTSLAGEVRDFRPEERLEECDAASLPRAAQMALAACRDAIQDAGLKPSSMGGMRIGLLVGTSVGDQKFLEQYGRGWREHALNGGPPRGCDSISCGHLCSHLAWRLGLSGPNWALFNSCASGNYALAHAARIVSSGRAEAMIAGAAEAFSRAAFAGFSSLRLLTDEPCRPFDERRRGFFLGEGAAMILVESLAHARKRRARIQAEILGSGITSDAYHFVSPHADGKAAVMTQALSQAAIGPEQVSYINAHGNATRHNDVTETQAIKKAFGECASAIPVTSIKGVTGHCMAASSALESVACILSIRRGVIPPTWNLERPDPRCDLDYVPARPRPAKVDIAMNNSFAFGGANASLVLRRWEE